MNLNITIEQPEKRLALFGSADRYLRMLRDTFGVTITSRGDEVMLAGEKDAVSRTAGVLDRMQKKLRRQDWLSADDVGSAIGQSFAAEHGRAGDEIDVYAKGAVIKPKTEGQQAYVRMMFANDLTFCVGPAGTGKTYLAVAVAATLLK
ncbi:MAG: ybeZ, partial [Phycisphaerales bacterium]|nr:ybeZ [Phycisphaerales bacterium]